VKYEFVKEHGKLIEKIMIDSQPKWIYIKYNKGNFEKVAYTIKNNSTLTQDFIENFIDDYHVSEEIKVDVRKYVKERSPVESNFQEFINFLLKTTSLHLMIGVALGLSIYGGYRLGTALDLRYTIYPAFTLIGVFAGVTIGSLTGYVMMLKYLGTHAEQGGIPAVKKALKRKKRDADFEWPVIEATLNDIREAVRKFSAELPKGINRTLLVKDDYSIDFEQLAPYLEGIPTRSFYMSKETYEIFEENDKEIPAIIDKVQKSVNLYFRVNNQYPVRPYDPLSRVNFYQLLQGKYLDKHPNIELYFTDFEGLITNQKPEKKIARG
jgi:hypothetical protein